ncbi:RNA polymerase sigma factor [Anaerolineales bacterium HSG6]|nr:RNA polymerase sigma factor [Anaerolineales bacterium HSG6]MDM8531125.1 RNA polymerase sigma factor [Anaerolineales bacterium HSG25]
MNEHPIPEKRLAQQALIERWQNDDPDAFDELYTLHSSAIYRLGWAMLQQAESAEDVVQETFIRAHKARLRYDYRKASFSTWLYQIALNYCRSHLRRKRLLTIPWLTANNETPDFPDRRPGPEMHALRGEYRRLLWDSVQNLSVPLREVVTLHYYMEIPAVEIAKMLGCPEGTIYSRLHNARRALAKSLTAKGVTGTERLEPLNAH